LVLLEQLVPKATGVTLDRMVLLVLLEEMVMLDLRDVLVPLVMLDQLELRDFKEHVGLRVNLDLKDCQDLKDQLVPLVPRVKREQEVFVENLVNLAKEEKLVALV